MAQCGVAKKRGVRGRAGVWMARGRARVRRLRSMRPCGGIFTASASVCFSFAGSWWRSKGLFSVPGICRGHCAVRPLCGLRCCFLPRALLQGRQGERGPCAGLGVEARHGPCRDGGCPARRLCRTVLQCKKCRRRASTNACTLPNKMPVCKPAPGLQTEAGRVFCRKEKPLVWQRPPAKKLFAFGSRQTAESGCQSEEPS